MASKNKKRMRLRDAAGLTTMVLAVAGMIAPTLATAQDRGERGGGRNEARSEQRMERGRVERMPDAQPRQAAPAAPAAAPRQDRPDGNRQLRQAPQGAQVARPQGQEGQRQGWRGQGNGNQGAWQQQQQQRAANGNVVRDGRTMEQWRAQRDARRGEASNDRNGADRQRQEWRGQGNGNAATWQQQRSAAGNVGRDGRDGRGNEQWRNQRDDRNRWQDGRRYSDNRNNDRGNSWQGNRGDNRNWDRGWRSNSRYDWSSYRTRNRAIYRQGRYAAPYRNYGYSRLGVGFTLGSLFYGQNYWISDPWSYRLPEVYGDYRWVRYYNDVLLVDTYSGEVVDVIYDFFW